MFVNVRAPSKAARLSEHEGGHVIKYFEHVPKRLRLVEGMTLNSEITKHHLDTGHQVDSLQFLKVINKQPGSSLRNFAEVVDIRRQKPYLYVQKELAVNLSLPW